MVCDEEDITPGTDPKVIDLPRISDAYEVTAEGLSVTVAEGVKLDGIDVGTKTIGGVANSPFSRFRTGIYIKADNVASGDKGITVQSKGNIDASLPIQIRAERHNNIKVEVMAGLLQSNTSAIKIDSVSKLSPGNAETFPRGNIDVTLSGTAVVRGHSKTYNEQDATLTRANYSPRGIDIYRHITKGGDMNVVLKDTAKIGGVGGSTDYGIYIHDDEAHEAGVHSAIKVTTGAKTLIGEDKTNGEINEEGIYVKIEANRKHPTLGAAERTVTVVHDGQLYAKGIGIKVEHVPFGTASSAAGATADITIGKTGVVQVSGDEYGIYLNTPDRLAADDRRKQSVTIKGGKVWGKAAGGGAIDLQGGGVVTIEGNALLMPDDATAAYRSIKVSGADTVGAGKSNLLIRLDRINKDFTGIKNIENDKTKTAFSYRSKAGDDYTDLTMGTKVTVTNILGSQVPCGFYNDCLQMVTDEFTPSLVDVTSGVFSLNIERDANFKPTTGVMAPETETREPSKRGRVYDALPSVLWTLAGAMDTYRPAAMGSGTAGASGLRQVAQNETLMAADDGRSADRRAWGRLEAGSGKGRLQRQTVTDELTYDTSYGGFAAGVDLPGTDGMLFRVGLHHRQGKADVTDGGRVKFSGTGIGVGMTREHAGGMLIDGWLGATQFDDIRVTSSEMLGGQAIKVDAKTKATGYVIGVGISDHMDLGRMSLTQRGGLSWSSMSVKDYTVPTIAGTYEPDQVATKKTAGVTGQYGVLLEQMVGQQTVDCCRLFGSLDLEHNFNAERRVTVTNGNSTPTSSESEVKPTTVRLGLGGSTSWDAGQSVISAALYHTTSGSGNKVTSGQIALSVRF